jgi:transcriptional regulator with XRE-family HTH domain
MSPRHLSTIVQTLREKRQLNQRELAKKAGVSNGYIGHLEMRLSKNSSRFGVKCLAVASHHGFH